MRSSCQAGRRTSALQLLWSVFLNYALRADVAREWERIRSEYKVPYFPHISIGWDNNPRYNSLTYPIMRNNTPEEVKKGFEMAKAFSDKYNTTPLITINSWNEWTEMSYLEPDDVYGYGYLEAVRDVFLK